MHFTVQWEKLIRGKMGFSGMMGGIQPWRSGSFLGEVVATEECKEMSCTDPSSLQIERKAGVEG